MEAKSSEDAADTSGGSACSPEGLEIFSIIKCSNGRTSEAKRCDTP